MRKNLIRIIWLFCLLALAGCSEKPQPEKVEVREEKPSFEEIKSIILAKLNSQTLIRTYGEDTGQTKVIFENDGHFRGDYFGKIAADGKDYGLTGRAQIYYHAEEIHSSEFRGKIDLTSMLDEYRYQAKLVDYNITSKEGAHDDIYYNVDFALGLDKEDDYILYRPGAPIKDLEKDDRLIDLAKKSSQDGQKIRGFILYNKTKAEVFFQRY